MVNLIQQRVIFKQVKSALIYSNLWVAFSLAALTCVAAIHLNWWNTRSFLFNFCIAYTGYNYIYWSVYFLSPEKIKARRRSWMKKHQSIVISSGLITALAAILIFLDSTDINHFALIAFICLSVTYVIPGKGNRGIRFIPFIKILIITISLTLLITIYIPLEIISDNKILFIALFAFIVAYTIPFDIRDLKSDPKRLKTIPQLIGTDHSVRLSQTIVIVVISILCFKSNNTLIYVANLLFGILSLIAFEKVKHNSNRDYINFYIEGLPVWWLILLLLPALV